jgi:hypothetical protein
MVANPLKAKARRHGEPPRIKNEDIASREEG